MSLTSSPTELTTSITDAILAVECLLIVVFLRRGEIFDSWRVALWGWVFRLMAFSSLLGALLHAFAMPGLLQIALWRMLYLTLGILVALFMIAAVYDLRGLLLTARLIPCGILAGFAFLALTELTNHLFIVFVAYEETAMAFAMAIYFYLAIARKPKGALLVAIAILVNMAAGAVQASGLAISGPLPLDHNGLFHLLQMAGAALLGIGVKKGMPK
jgi:hypothetical protein